MLEFLETNYVWLIVIGVIILMTVIGYFAEKYDNTKKQDLPKKEKDIKPEKEEIEVEPEVQIYNENASLDDWNSLPEIDEEISQPEFEDNIHEENYNEENSYDYEVKEPVISEEVKNEEISYDEEFNTNEQVDTVIDSNYQIEQDETDNELKNEDLEITLPSIESLDEEIKDVVEEDDVWKF